REGEDARGDSEDRARKTDGVAASESPGLETRGWNGTKSAFADYAAAKAQFPTGRAAAVIARRCAGRAEADTLARYGRGFALQGAGRGRRGRDMASKAQVHPGSEVTVRVRCPRTPGAPWRRRR